MVVDPSAEVALERLPYPAGIGSSKFIVEAGYAPGQALATTFLVERTRALTAYRSEIGGSVVRPFVLLGSLVGMVAGTLCSEGTVSACAVDVAEV